MPPSPPGKTNTGRPDPSPCKVTTQSGVNGVVPDPSGSGGAGRAAGTVRISSMSSAISAGVGASNNARGARSRPTRAPSIATADGTWHRLLTTLELAALQGLPIEINGRPLDLAGSITDVREHIGNAVPVGAAAAIAEQMLLTLVSADAGVFRLSSGGGVWVTPKVRARGVALRKRLRVHRTRFEPVEGFGLGGCANAEAY